MPLRRDMMPKASVNASDLRPDISLGSRDSISTDSSTETKTPTKSLGHQHQIIEGKVRSMIPASIPQMQSPVENLQGKGELPKFDMSDASAQVSSHAKSERQKPTFRQNVTSSVRSGSKVKSAQPRKEATSTFDDTETLDFDDHSMHVSEPQTVVFRGIDERTADSNKFAVAAGIQRDPSPHAISRTLGPTWQEEVDEERRYLGLARKIDDSHPHQDRKAVRNAGFNAMKSQMQDRVQDTPSRSNRFSRSLPAEPSGLVKNVTFADSPSLRSRDLVDQVSVTDLEPQSRPHQAYFGSVRSFDAARQNWMPNETGSNYSNREPPNQASLIPSQEFDQVKTQQESNMFAIKSGFESSNNSVEANSIDGDSIRSHHPATGGPRTDHKPTSRKRGRDAELDHSLESLKAMTYVQLQEEDFTYDPQDADTSDSSKPDAKSIDIARQLEDLDKNDEEDQRAQFRAHNDEQWSATGSWFIQRFSQDLKRLMQARFKRRKVSMEHEQILRRRQKEVEWCMSGVDKELEDLKKGGGQLIEGRTSRTSTANN